MKIQNINNSHVIENPTLPIRWRGVIGEDAIIYESKAGTANTTEWTATAVSAGAGTSALTNSVLADSWGLITNAANENDGLNMQLKGSNYTHTAGKQIYVEGAFTISDATQSDFLFGLAGVDTTLVAAHAIACAAGGCFFYKDDGAATITFNVYAAASLVSSVAVGTITTDEIVLGYHYDGESIHVYVDGEEMACVTTGIPSTVMTPSIVLQNGAAAVKTMEIGRVKAYEV